MLQILGRLERNHIIQKIKDGSFPLLINDIQKPIIILSKYYFINSDFVLFNCNLSSDVLHKKVLFSFIYFNVLYSFESCIKEVQFNDQKKENQNYSFICELGQTISKSDLVPEFPISNISFTSKDIFYKLYFNSSNNNIIRKKNNESNFAINTFFLGEIESIDHKSFSLKIVSYIANSIDDQKIPFVYKHIAKHINRDIVCQAIKENITELDSFYSRIIFKIVNVKKEDERFLYEQRYNKNYT